MGRSARDVVDDVIRDLDLVVYRLERPAEDPEQLRAERAQVRRELERLKDALAAVIEQV